MNLDKPINDQAPLLSPLCQDRHRQKMRVTTMLVTYFLICTMFWNQTMLVRSFVGNVGFSLFVKTSSEQPVGPDDQHALNHTLRTRNNKTNYTKMENLTNVAYNTNQAHTPKGQAANGTFALPIANVVLMGQFNFDTPFDTVRDWVKIWSAYFIHIVVAGPFSVETQEKLGSSGIEFQIGMDDKGYVSPYQNLLNTMIDFQGRANHHSVIQRPEAVLYLHDDALLNIRELFKGREFLPNDIIIKSPIEDTKMEKQMAYSIHVERERRRWPNGTEFSKVVPRFIFEHNSGNNGNITMYRSIAELMGELPRWDHWEMCLRQQLKMLSEYDEEWWEDFSDYSNVTVIPSSVPEVPFANASYDIEPSLGGSEAIQLLSRISYRFTFPGLCQSDFLFVPLQYTDILARAVRPHAENAVFLECAVPTIVHWIVQNLSRNEAGSLGRAPSTGTRSPALSSTAPIPPVPTVETLSFCTEWDYSLRGTEDMIVRCLDLSRNWGMYHPLKIGKIGAKAFSFWLGIVQRAALTTKS